MSEQNRESLEEPPPNLSSVSWAAEATEIPHEISWVNKILAGVALGTVGSTPAAAASHYSSPPPSSQVLPVPGPSAKESSPAVYPVSTGPEGQSVAAFGEPSEDRSEDAFKIAQLMSDMQQAASKQQVSTPFQGWGTTTLTIVASLAAVTRLLKAGQPVRVKIVENAGKGKSTAKAGDTEIRLESSQAIELALQTWERLKGPHVTLE